MDKKFIESFWSGASQIAASKLLDLWQINFNKSINNIQEYRQARWLRYDTELPLGSTKLILTDDQAGIGNTIVTGLFIQPEETNQINVGLDLRKLNNIAQANKVITLDRGYISNRITNTTVFFDGNTVAGKTNIPWRFSSTLKTELDLEKLGVSKGDILVIRIYRGNKYYDINCQVIGVAGSYLGFVWNTDTLTAGTASNTISVNDQVQAAKALGVKLDVDIQGNPIYVGDALAIKTEITSIAWKRQNYEKELLSVTILGEFIQLEPIKIIRKSRIAIDSKIKAIPTLQEYILAPDYYELNGEYFRTDNNKKITKPIKLEENADYILLSNNGLNVTINTNINSNLLQLPFSDLDKFRIEPGDKLVIKKGLNAGEYKILSIVNKEQLRVTKNLITTEVGIEGIIYKRVSNNWIVFTQNKLNPNLWAEVTFLDNNTFVEDNFGSLAGLTYEDFIKQNIPISYKSAVAGLMHMLTTGSQLESIRLGATILLGLPFTTNAGTITSIDKTYRLNLVTGAPEYGRIVVTRANGIEDVYYYPRGKQEFVNGVWVDTDAVLSGIAINPKTNKEYTINDTVDKYVSLTKGVEVGDYISNDSWSNDLITEYSNINKYHTFYIRANPDMYGVASLSYVATYMNKTKPTYLYIKTIASKTQKDNIKITDKMVIDIEIEQLDGVGFGAPPEVYRNKIDTLAMVDWSGRLFYRLIRGTANITTLNSTVNTTPGLVSSPYHDEPFVRSGDTVKFVYSKNAGLYTVSSVTSDTALVLTTGALQGEQVPIAIYRQIKNPIITGTLGITQGSTSVVIPGKFSAGVSPGDYFVFFNNAGCSMSYRVVSVGATVGLDKAITEASGSYIYYIFRAALADKKIGPYSLVADGTNGLQVTNIDTNFITMNGWNLEIGNNEYKIIDWKPELVSICINTTMAAGNYTGNIINNGRIIGFNTRDKYIEDKVSIELYSDGNAVMTNNNKQVTTNGIDNTISTRPGDLLKIVSGANNKDCGYGPGLYPIANIINANTIELTRDMTATETKKFYIVKNY